MIDLHATWLVNSATHLHGGQRFATRDESRNSWWVALLTGAKAGITIITRTRFQPGMVLPGVSPTPRRRKSKTAALRNRFGSEYDRAVQDDGSLDAAEGKLSDRGIRRQQRSDGGGFADPQFEIVRWNVGRIDIKRTKIAEQGQKQQNNDTSVPNRMNLLASGQHCIQCHAEA